MEENGDGVEVSEEGGLGLCDGQDDGPGKALDDRQDLGVQLDG
jgi:hypothetical protein